MRGREGKKLPRGEKAPTAKWQTTKIGECFDMFYPRLPLTSNSSFIIFIPETIRGRGATVKRRQ